MNTINPAAYEQMARCLREYQLSAEQERDLFADEGFAAWYANQTTESPA